MGLHPLTLASLETLPGSSTAVTMVSFEAYLGYSFLMSDSNALDTPDLSYDNLTNIFHSTDSDGLQGENTILADRTTY